MSRSSLAELRRDVGLGTGAGMISHCIAGTCANISACGSASPYRSRHGRASLPASRGGSWGKDVAPRERRPTISAW